MAADKLKEQFIKARKFGVPIVGIETPDMAATLQALMEVMEKQAPAPVLAWDVVRGLRALNKSGEVSIQGIAQGNAAALMESTINPVEMLSLLQRLPKKTCVFMMNAHRFYEDIPVAQAVWNLRDTFKTTERTLVMLGPVLHMPHELDKDILLFDEPLPEDEALGALADNLYNQTGNVKKLDKGVRENTVMAARGLSLFGAEQAIALSLNKQGIDVDQLWEHKRKMVEQTKGLRFYRGGETFEDIGGIERLKYFGRLLFGGKRRPACIVWVDEMEKAMAGSAGPVADSSGTSQDQLGQLLTEMQNNEWSGMILPGPPGCAKSLFAKALGTTFGVPCIQLDLGAMKGSLVGESERQIRQAMKVIKAVAGTEAYWVATCNRMESLPPELRRRFGDGVWFVDLPDATERQSIWKILRAKYNIPETDTQPEDKEYTGADIRNVCSIAYRLQIKMKEAAKFITPVAKSDPASIERLRKLAHKSFLSASRDGVYEYDPERREVSVGETRKVQL